MALSKFPVGVNAGLIFVLISTTVPAESFSLRHHRFFQDITRDEDKTLVQKKFNFLDAQDHDPVETFKFKQKLDHFLDGDLREWQQIAYINKKYYKPGGPIFLMISGEGPSTEKLVRQGAMAELYARQLNAMLLSLEHRFYGRSWPTPDMSVENLQYLSSQQALADIAYFITEMAAKLQLDPERTRWVTFGGSYAGALSAWMRLKYPQLVFAAVASSAPVEAVVDFAGYLEVVVDVLNTNDKASSTCVDTLKQATAKVVELMQTDTGRQQLDQLFNLCSPLQDLPDVNEKDLWAFYSALIGGFEGAVQYNHDYAMDVTDACTRYLDDSTRGEPIERMRDFLEAFTPGGNSQCLAFAYNDSIAEEQEISWKYWQVPGGRQWLWQTCTEFGYFQTTTTEKTIFETELPLDFYLSMCQDVFGDGNYSASAMQEKIGQTNDAYGGNSSRVDWSRIVFVNGGADPWHVLSVLESGKNQIDKDAMKSVVVPNQSHCADMFAPRSSDSQEMTEARKLVLNSLNTWLQEAEKKATEESSIEEMDLLILALSGENKLLY